jgi:hypothetical protein
MNLGSRGHTVDVIPAEDPGKALIRAPLSPRKSTNFFFQDLPYERLDRGFNLKTGGGQLGEHRQGKTQGPGKVTGLKEETALAPEARRRITSEKSAPIP